MANRFIASSRLYVVVRACSAVTTEAVLDSPGKLAPNVRHRKDAQGSVRWSRILRCRPSLRHAAVGEHRYQGVLQIGRRFSVGEPQTSGQVGAWMNERGCRQYVEVAPGGRLQTAKGNLDVGSHRAIVLADPGDVRHELVRIGDGRRALDRQEIAEPVMQLQRQFYVTRLNSFARSCLCKRNRRAWRPLVIAPES